METTLTVTETHENERKWGKGTTYREMEAKPRLYVHVEGESILENFVYRFDRPAKAYRTLLPQIFEQLGIDPNCKAVWSQKAGCSCGCSPGFVLTGSGKNRVDFWATVTVTQGETLEAKTTDPESDTALNRFAALKAQVIDPMAEFAAKEQDAELQIRSGRGPAGNLRNFAQMSDKKLVAVTDLVVEEGNDEEAIEAASNEMRARGL